MSSDSTAERASTIAGGASFACLAHYLLLVISFRSGMELRSGDILYQLVRAIHSSYGRLYIYL